MFRTQHIDFPLACDMIWGYIQAIVNNQAIILFSFGGVMWAEIISCGTELLLGHITDTNATYLAQSLTALGIDLYFVSQVGDNLGRIVDTLKRAWERSELIIMTGGLGPTEDDLARESISTFLGETMRVDPELETELRNMFAARNS